MTAKPRLAIVSVSAADLAMSYGAARDSEVDNASTQVVFSYGQLSNSLARRSMDRVAERSHKCRNAGLANPCWGSVAINNMNVGLKGRFTHSGNAIVKKIGLIDCAIRRRNLSTSDDARSKNHGALKLEPGWPQD